MPNLTIDIAKEITALNSRYLELSTLEMNPQGPTADDKTEQRVQISYSLTEINNRITILRLISAHRSSTVVVSRPTQNEINSIQTALEKLDKVIGDEQTFEQTVKNVTTLLKAADAVNAAAK
jgi:hypothetical protein